MHIILGFTGLAGAAIARDDTSTLYIKRAHITPITIVTYEPTIMIH